MTEHYVGHLTEDPSLRRVRVRERERACVSMGGGCVWFVPFLGGGGGVGGWSCTFNNDVRCKVYALTPWLRGVFDPYGNRLGHVCLHLQQLFYGRIFVNSLAVVRHTYLCMRMGSFF